ncbi:nucleotide-binding universal stress UspA family protein [Geomicrobium halophilum]|uniref:Nucleotide-binding universal stress UspA family protein n=1 Tax=Geomicrobium halophilum TaxID=549000 RepID=A0A841PH93_9BACL|nr:universal stress protein [Geomicrobium halophilum]MBB6448160.1 nucleotide-binding universal stress UspA family protein [Geomicrobium halophilum]
MRRYNRILVGVDGSNESSYTFEQACEFAIDQGATLFITTVIDTKTFATIERFDRQIVKRAEEQGHETLKNFKQKALDQGVENVETILDFGSPKVRITRHIAPKYDIDLIMAGATGANRVERMVIGSVSEAIVRQAACDVLIVRWNRSLPSAEEEPPTES